MNEILICTNDEGRRIADKKNKEWKNITEGELWAFTGIVLLAGKEKSWDVSVRELFLSRFSNPHFRSTMSYSICSNCYGNISLLPGLGDIFTVNTRGCGSLWSTADHNRVLTNHGNGPRKPKTNL